jgi:hypothetical protein
MSTSESTTPTQLPWALGNGQPYDIVDLNPMPGTVDFIPQSGTLDLTFRTLDAFWDGEH